MASNGNEHNLSKSRLIAFRQCPRRLWLEIHQPKLAEPSPEAEARFRVGYQVGEIARQRYDPDGSGTMIDPRRDGYPAAIAQSLALLKQRAPIFEATFAADGARALADVMLPTQQGDRLAWRMVEVKSSTSVKGYQLDDVAIQAHIALTAGVPLHSVSIAYIDSSWVYQGDGNYRGLLHESDHTSNAVTRGDEVRRWIAEAQATAAMKAEPQRRTGPHCREPFECPFQAHCKQAEPQAQYPATWLPRIQKKLLKSHIVQMDVPEMADVPDTLLNDMQLRVKSVTLTNLPYFDAKGAANDLKPHKLPAIFLDFETVCPAVPIWKGTRPYQQIPFQFSAHYLSASHHLDHVEFLDLSGDDPRRSFAEALIEACGATGPIFVYNACFETSRVRELAEAFLDLRAELLSIKARVVDLMPIAQRRYYHPNQCGSWSIKKVLPTIAPDLSYASLDGIQDGTMAMEAYLEAISPQASAEDKAKIKRQLLAYCRLDTLAMVWLWEFFSGAKRSAPTNR